MEAKARRSNHLILERGFDHHFTTSESKRSHSCRHAAPANLLIEKLRKQSPAGELDSTNEPLAKLVGRGGPPEPAPSFTVGEEVEVRDKGMSEWHPGVVANAAPLRVWLLEWGEDFSFSWDRVRRRPVAPSKPRKAPAPRVGSVRPEAHCMCGRLFLPEDIFCSRCGRQRGCELASAAPVPPAKPPRAPSERDRPENAGGAPASRASAPPRVSASRAPAPSDGEGAHVKCVWCGGGHASRDCRRSSGFSDSAPSELTGGFCSRPSSAHSRDSPRSSLEQRILPRQRWQQLTVPILADGGNVIELRPVEGDGLGVWQQQTVPILGENGEVIALRASSGAGPSHAWRQIALPIFNEAGHIVAVPDGAKCEWKQGTVPVLGQNGEVVALRPPQSNKEEWRQRAVPIFNAAGHVVAVSPAIGSLQRWQQLTVPIVADNGNVVGLRPTGGRYEMPAWGGESLSHMPGCSERRVMASAGSAIMADPPLAAASANNRKSEKRSSRDNNFPGLTCDEDLPRWAQEGHRAPLEAKGTSRLDSLRVESACSSLAASQSECVPIAVVQDCGQRLIAAASARGEKDVRESNAQNAESEHAPENPKMDEILRSASCDSLASLNEILRMCNDAKQATPQGHVMDVLRDALGPQTGTSGPRRPQLPRAPESDELVGRLRQLPELWRRTIFEMLEQAEAVQPPTSPQPPHSP